MSAEMDATPAKWANALGNSDGKAIDVLCTQDAVLIGGGEGIHLGPEAIAEPGGDKPPSRPVDHAPPVTWSSSPVTQEASSEARKTATGAMSVG